MGGFEWELGFCGLGRGGRCLGSREEGIGCKECGSEREEGYKGEGEIGDRDIWGGYLEWGYGRWGCGVWYKCEGMRREESVEDLVELIKK